MLYWFYQNFLIKLFLSLLFPTSAAFWLSRVRFVVHISVYYFQRVLFINSHNGKNRKTHSVSKYSFNPLCLLSEFEIVIMVGSSGCDVELPLSDYFSQNFLQAWLFEHLLCISLIKSTIEQMMGLLLRFIVWLFTATKTLNKV